MVRVTKSSRGGDLLDKRSLSCVALGVVLGASIATLLGTNGNAAAQLNASGLLLSSSASSSLSSLSDNTNDSKGKNNAIDSNNVSPQMEYQQLQNQQQQGSVVPSFLQLATKHGTDKVRGTNTFPQCRTNAAACARPQAVNDGCKVTGHFYDRIYQKWLAPLAEERFQFLEIGYYHGKGFDAYTDLLPAAELHSLEVSCLPQGQRSEGKWPYGNFAIKNARYQALRDNHRLHCGDASTWQFLQHTWNTYMNRTSTNNDNNNAPAPPLRVVVEDASHIAKHMVTSVFFWFPRLAPGGIMVVEDIESQTVANPFRTDFLPQLLADLHYCGLPESGDKDNHLCFPTLQPLLRAVHCELHICVLERNDEPAVEYNEEQSMPPAHALDYNQCRQGNMAK